MTVRCFRGASPPEPAGERMGAWAGAPGSESAGCPTVEPGTGAAAPATPCGRRLRELREQSDTGTGTGPNATTPLGSIGVGWFGGTLLAGDVRAARRAVVDDHHAVEHHGRVLSRSRRRAR